MANYMSSPVDYGKTMDSSATDLLGKVATIKQQKYDANYALVQNTLDQYGNIDLLRSQDKEYLSEKLQKVTDVVNNAGNRDLSRNNVTRSIQSQIKSALDENVLTQIAQTQKYRVFENEVANVKKSKPELYSDVNYSFARAEAGFDEYMNGVDEQGNKVDKLGNLKYTPYKDLTEEHLKKLKTIKDLKGKRFIEIPDGMGGTQKKEIDGLTNQEIQEYFGSITTPEEQQQMTINGWGRYGGDKNKARQNFSEYNTKLQSVYENDLNLAKAKVANTSLPETEREDAERDVKSIETKIEQAKTKVDKAGSYNMNNIYLDLEKASYLSGLSNIASSEWSTSTEKDEVYFAKENLKIAQEDLAIKKDKDSRDALEQKLKLQKEYGTDENGKPVTEDQISVTSRRDELPEEVDGLQSLQQQSDAQFKIVKETTLDLLSNLEPSQKKHFIAELKKRGVDESLNKIGQGRVVITDAIQEAFDASNLGIYKTYAEKIRDASSKKDVIADDIVRVSNEAYSKKFKENPNEYVESTIEDIRNFSLMSKSFDTFNSFKDFNNFYRKITKDNSSFNTEQAYEEFKRNPEFFNKEKLKQALLTSPQSLLEFSTVQDKIENRLGAVENTVKFNWKGSNLKKDAKQYVEDNLKEKSKSGNISTFTVYDNINFLDKNTRERIINRIPQDRIEGATFDAKGSLTARRVGENIEILQYKSSKYGVPLYAKATYDKGDKGLYDEVNKLVEFEESNRTSINVNQNYTFKKRSPRFATNENNEFKEQQYVNVIEKSIAANKNIATSFQDGIQDPRYFATPKLINNNLKEALKYAAPKVDKKYVDDFVNTYTKNINEFSLKIVQRDAPTDIPGDRVFGFEVFNPNGKSIGVSMLGVKNLDKDTRYLLEYQPQVYMTNYIYKMVKEDPNYMEQVFKK